MNSYNLQKYSKLMERISVSPWLAYPAVFLLQIKVMFWIWKFRDLTPGDASEYHFRVIMFLDETKVDLVWSPIYTVLLGIFYRIFNDPFQVTIAAQIAIAVCASLLFLALARQILPKHVALLISFWWTLLPINYDTVYNVHLFSALFPLGLFLIASIKDDRLGRGLVLGGFLLAGVLVRTEYLALFTLWLLVISGYEASVARQRYDAPSVRTNLFSYGVPVVLALLVIGVFYTRATPQYPEITRNIDSKTTLYVCQNYAYSRIQIGDTWHGDPWTECQEVVERDFGRPAVTFVEAIFINPGKVFEHIWWNIRLIPAGTQLALFNAYSGGVNPDFMRAQKTSVVWFPFLCVVGLALFGAIKGLILPLMKQRHSIPKGLTWLLMLCVALSVVGIMLMVRPRPSYMFPYTAFLMLLAGLGLSHLLGIMRIDTLVRWLTPMTAVALILLAPSHYDARYDNHFGGQGQAWKKTYAQVAPYIDRGTARQPSIVVLPTGGYNSLCNYLGVECVVEDSEAGISMLTGPANSVEISRRYVYALYLEDMIWRFTSDPSDEQGQLQGYIELQCASLKNDVMRCSDGIVDFTRGMLNDGTGDIPLQAAIVINDGHVVDQIDYHRDLGYILQVIMKNNRIQMILVLDSRLFQENFNQYFLLGRFNNDYFTEVYSDVPSLRILEVKGNRPDDAIHH